MTHAQSDQTEPAPRAARRSQRPLRIRADRRVPPDLRVLAEALIDLARDIAPDDNTGPLDT